MTNFLVGVFSGLAVLITSVLRVSCCPRNVYQDYALINMQRSKHICFQTSKYDQEMLQSHITDQLQSELPRPIPWNSVESDHGCTSRIYFYNTGDNVTLMLYSVTLVSRKPC